MEGLFVLKRDTVKERVVLNSVVVGLRSWMRTWRVRQGIRHPEPSTQQAAAGLQSSEGTLKTSYSARGDD